jgi:hypothetical protein
MMQVATWISVLILGPGSVAIFIWFLLTLKQVFRKRS